MSPALGRRLDLRRVAGLAVSTAGFRPPWGRLAWVVWVVEVGRRVRLSAAWLSSVSVVAAGGGLKDPAPGGQPVGRLVAGSRRRWGWELWVW